MGVVLSVALVLVGAFCLGSIPFAVIVSRLFFHTDIRSFGSGNPGATNVLRTFGPPAGLATFALDILKGAAAVYLARWLGPAQWSVDGRDWLMIAAAIAAIAGHAFSPFIGFKGGKGVATAAGAIVVLAPVAFFVLFSMFLVIVLLTRMVSLGSIMIALELPVLCVVLYGDRTPIMIFGVLVGAIIVALHRSNLRRIFRGEEHKIGTVI